MGEKKFCISTYIYLSIYLYFFSTCVALYERVEELLLIFLFPCALDVAMREGGE